jgi:hypothetical protein
MATDDTTEALVTDAFYWARQADAYGAEAESAIKGDPTADAGQAMEMARTAAAISQALSAAAAVRVQLDGAGG